MHSNDIFNKPNGFFALVTAIALALLPTFNAKGIIWFFVCIWLVLWFFALLVQAHDRTNRRMIRALRGRDFKHLYVWLTGKTLARLWHRLCDPAPSRASVWQTFRAALTLRLYDRALLLAVVYPLALLIGIWIVSGDAGRLGAFTVLPEAAFFWDRAMALGLFALLTSSLIARNLAAASRHRVVQQAAGWLPLITVAGAVAVAVAGAVAGEVAVAFAVAFAGAFAGAVAGEVAGAFAVAVAFAFAVAGAFAGAFAFAFAGAFAVAVAFAVAGAFAFVVLLEHLDGKGKQRWARLLLSLSLPALWAALLIGLPWHEVPGGPRSLFLFLGVFPLVNAVFDLLSYAATLSLMRLGLRRWHPIVTGLLDLLIACGLFLLLGLCLTALLSAMNAISGVRLIDLGAVFAGAWHTPESYLWLFFMLFSTILPTAIHAGLALVLGAQALMFRVFRRPLADLAETPPDAPFAPVIAPPLIAALALLPIAFLTGLAWVLQAYWEPALTKFLIWYYQILLNVSHGLINAF